MGASVTAVIEQHGGDMRPGDSFMVNSPYHGGTHLPDITVVTPVFDSAGRQIHFFTASRAHHADVGGITPGSMPPGRRSIGEEGALIARHASCATLPDVAGVQGARAACAQRAAESSGPARNWRPMHVANANCNAPPTSTEGHPARLHAPRAGQRRTVHAPSDPPAAQRLLPLRDGRCQAIAARITVDMTRAAQSSTSPVLAPVRHQFNRRAP